MPLLGQIQLSSHGSSATFGTGLISTTRSLRLLWTRKKKIRLLFLRLSSSESTNRDFKPYAYLIKSFTLEVNQRNEVCKIERSQYWNRNLKKGVVLVICTYSLIALIKLDLPLPESPVIAMFTSTSRHFSSLLLKNSSIFDTPLSSISFLSSAISSISHSLKSAMLNRDKSSK